MILFLVVMISFIVLIGYMFYKAFADEVTYEIIKHDKIPEAFRAYNIFFITDIHRRKLKETTLHSINSNIDLVLIGGDLVERGVSLHRMRENLILLKRWNVPVYFVWGNNDYKADYIEIRKILLEESVTILEDETIEITRDNSMIKLIGFRYYSDPEQLPKIDWKEKSDEFTMVLTHTPASFFNLPEISKRKIDFVLAGHTHGGQIRLYQFGLDIKGGYYVENGTEMFISEGYGYRLIPFRFQTQAECHIISLQPK